MPVTVPAAPDWAALRKRLEHVTAHPEEWRQATWGVRGDLNLRTHGVPAIEIASGAHCGTVACLAGGILLDAGLAEFDARGGLHPPADTLPPWASIPDEYTGHVAALVLGLDPAEANPLWVASNTLRALWRIAAALSGGEIEVPAELPAWADVRPGPYDPSDADAVARYRAAQESPGFPERVQG